MIFSHVLYDIGRCASDVLVLLQRFSLADLAFEMYVRTRTYICVSLHHLRVYSAEEFLVREKT